jgi:hypothetical protein
MSHIDKYQITLIGKDPSQGHDAVDDDDDDT